jgi:hemoglobin-like flavoprotein
MARYQISDGTYLSVDAHLIRSSFAQVQLIGPEAVSGVRDYLFSHYPESVPLFANIDLDHHNFGWVETLLHVTDNLENEKESELRRYLFELGLRHVKYGAELLYYDWVGNAMINGFAQLCPEIWTQEVADEWCKLYVIMKSMMMDGHNSTLPESDRAKVWTIESLQAVGYRGELLAPGAL